MKSKKENLLLAVDPSLSSSGWAVLSIDSGVVRAVGVVSPPGPKLALAKRLKWLQDYVEQLFQTLQMGSRDVLVCEGPAPLVLNPQSSLKVERVRSIFESVARAHEVVVPGRLNPRTVQTELLGMRGKQLRREEVKTWARETAMKLHGATLEALPVYGRASRKSKTISQDVIDAVLVGTLAVTKVQHCVRHKLDLTEAFEGKTRSRRHGATRRDLEKLLENL